MRRVLVTGSRNWVDATTMDQALMYELERSPEGMVVIHGGAKGADAMADHWASIVQRMGLPVKVESHNADWDRHGKAAGPIRNQEMVDAGADVCLAFPLGESRGTRHCMKAAEQAGIPVIKYGDPE